MKTALLVIDFINGIAAGNGSCADYLKNHPAVVENTNTLIKTARQQQALAVHVRLAFDPNYAGLPKQAPSANAIRSNKLFQLDTDATTFIAEIDIKPSDVIVNKTYGDVFHGNQLLQQLKDQAIEQILFTGVATDNAILNSANTAMLNNFFVTVIEDACGAPTETAHVNALAIMKGRTASEIINTSQAVERLVN